MDRQTQNKKSGISSFINKLTGSKPSILENENTSAPTTEMVKKILWPGQLIDLTIDSNSQDDQTDIRTTKILRISGKKIIVAQTDPPLPDSQIHKNIDASVVYENTAKNKTERWGWKSEVQSIEIIEQAEATQEDQKPQAIVTLSLPHEKDLSKTNLRFSYRIEITEDQNIIFTINNNVKKSKLINLSLNGLMFKLEDTVKLHKHQSLDFKINFPHDINLPTHTIDGKAKIMRITHNQKEKTIHYGIKFMDLSQKTKRDLSAVVQYYTLEERRRRSELNTS